MDNLSLNVQQISVWENQQNVYGMATTRQEGRMKSSNASVIHTLFVETYESFRLLFLILHQSILVQSDMNLIPTAASTTK